MRRYLHRKLGEYLGLHIRADDRVVYFESQAAAQQFQLGAKRSLVLRNDTSDTAKWRANLEAIAEFRPDYVVLDGNIHYEADVQAFLESLHSALLPTTRLIITFYSSLWKPLLRLATRLGWRQKTREENWIAQEDVANLLLLCNYELVRQDSKLLMPVNLPLISYVTNRFLAPLPGFRLFNLVNIAVGRPLRRGQRSADTMPSVSVVIPARNEAGNIEAAILRTPPMGPNDEMIFVEGNSTDATWKQICDLQTKYRATRRIRVVQQEGKGKADAVRLGLSMAAEQILMILDADLTVPPEELPRFYRALVEDKGEFINGSRLVYPVERSAMSFLNLLGNKFFAVMFSFLLGQRFKDTLCGTKALSRENYLKLSAHRQYFGDFDPFGDFDLIFGAARMALRMVEIPVHYRKRTYGSTNIDRWRHGAILLRMLGFAAKKVKFL